MQLVLECSFWNKAEDNAPNERTRNFHSFPEPVVYQALVGRLGLIEDEATVSAIVSVYSYILYINSLTSADIMTARDMASQNLPDFLRIATCPRPCSTTLARKVTHVRAPSNHRHLIAHTARG